METGGLHMSVKSQEFVSLPQPIKLPKLQEAFVLSNSSTLTRHLS